jgi:hypothetical protein
LRANEPIRSSAYNKDALSMADWNLIASGLAVAFAAATAEYARRADRRASRAEAAAQRAERRAEAADQRERLAVRAQALEEINILIHRIAGDQHAALSGSIQAVAGVTRRQVRLQEALKAVPDSFPNAQAVADAREGWPHFIAEAQREVMAAIARARAQAIGPAAV